MKLIDISFSGTSKFKRFFVASVSGTPSVGPEERTVPAINKSYPLTIPI
jgi:hypothetical protein